MGWLLPRLSSMIPSCFTIPFAIFENGTPINYRYEV